MPSTEKGTFVIMSKRNIYMVQVQNASEGSYFLPYSTGVLVAYAWSNEVVEENYKMKRFVFSKEDIDSAVESFENPFLVGFSNCIWNSNYNKEFAKRLKKKFPKCIILFGGKEIPQSNSYLEEYPFMDILMHLEGEESFLKILLELLNEDPDLSEISNISFRKSGKTTFMTKIVLPERIDYPSPYLSGVFDEMMKRKDVKFVTAIETNRGCPFNCSYCDFDTARNKVRLRPLEQVFAEIEWVGNHGIDYCACCDSNFGLFERDELIADKLIEVKTKTGFPHKFQVSAAKADIPAVFNINKKLNAHKMSKGATISFQTFSSEALHNVGRENISLERFTELMALYNKNGIPTFTDMILGLPGETYDSFCDGICKLLEAGQHTSIYVYSCCVLTNTPMWQKEYIEKYNISTIDVPFSQYHCDIKPPEEIEEYSREIISTGDMNVNDFVRAKLFSVCVQCFHCFGLLQSFAMYLFHEKGVSYCSFYNNLMDWMEKHSESICGEIFTNMKQEVHRYSNGERMKQYVNEVFGNITWPLEEGAFLDIVYRFDEFYNEIEDFLEQYSIDSDVYESLMKYQKCIIKMPGKNEFKVKLNYDLHNYFFGVYINSVKPLKKAKTVLTIKGNKIPDNWKDYSKKIVWFGRKGEKNLYTDITTEYID